MDALIPAMDTLILHSICNGALSFTYLFGQSLIDDKFEPHRKYQFRAHLYETKSYLLTPLIAPCTF